MDGFLHQKVMVIDDATATIGTANFDNRAFRLNFEVTALVGNQTFAAEVASMFMDNFSSSVQMPADAYDSKPYWFKLAVRFSVLFAPVL